MCLNFSIVCISYPLLHKTLPKSYLTVSVFQTFRSNLVGRVCLRVSCKVANDVRRDFHFLTFQEAGASDCMMTHSCGSRPEASVLAGFLQEVSVSHHMGLSIGQLDYGTASLRVNDLKIEPGKSHMFLMICPWEVIWHHVCHIALLMETNPDSEEREDCTKA